MRRLLLSLLLSASACHGATPSSIAAVLHTAGSTRKFCLACDGSSKAPPKAPAATPPSAIHSTSRQLFSTNESYFRVVDVASNATAGGCRAAPNAGFTPWLANSTSVAGAAVVFLRGNCTFEAMAQIAAGNVYSYTSLYTIMPPLSGMHGARSMFDAFG